MVISWYLVIKYDKMAYITNFFFKSVYLDDKNPYWGMVINLSDLSEHQLCFNVFTLEYSEYQGC